MNSAASSDSRNDSSSTLLPTIGLAQDAAGGTVVVYTPAPAQAVEAVIDSLRQLEPKITLSTITGGSGQLLRRLDAEASAPQADLFWSSSENTLGGFREMFEPYRSTQLDAIPAALHQPEDLWTATFSHVVVAMVNTDQLGDIPAPTTQAVQFTFCIGFPSVTRLPRTHPLHHPSRSCSAMEVACETRLVSASKPEKAADLLAALRDLR